MDAYKTKLSHPCSPKRECGQLFWLTQTITLHNPALGIHKVEVHVKSSGGQPLYTDNTFQREEAHYRPSPMYDKHLTPEKYAHQTLSPCICKSSEIKGTTDLGSTRAHCGCFLLPWPAGRCGPSLSPGTMALRAPPSPFQQPRPSQGHMFPGNFHQVQHPSWGNPMLALPPSQRWKKPKELFLYLISIDYKKCKCRDVDMMKPLRSIVQLFLW